MQTDPALWIIAAAVISGLACAAITAVRKDRRYRSIYNRGWMAGKAFAEQQREQDFSLPTASNRHPRI